MRNSTSQNLYLNNSLHNRLKFFRLALDLVWSLTLFFPISPSHADPIKLPPLQPHLIQERPRFQPFVNPNAHPHGHHVEPNPEVRLGKKIVLPPLEKSGSAFQLPAPRGSRVILSPVAPKKSSSKDLERKTLLESLRVLPASSRKILESHLDGFTPEQIKKLNAKISQIPEAPVRVGAHPESYQKTRQDQIEDLVLKRVGKNIVEKAVQKGAETTHTVVGYRAMNPAAFAHIARGDSVTKAMDLKSKTAPAQSLIGGLVPIDASFSKAGDQAQEVSHYNELNQKLLSDPSSGYKITYHTRQGANGETQFATFKKITAPNGKETIIEQWKTQDQLDEDPRWKKHQVFGKEITTSSGAKRVLKVTGDVDLAFVGQENHPNTQGNEQILNHKTLGRITPTEQKVIEEINHQAEGVAIVNHGSQALDPSSSPLQGKVIIIRPNGRRSSLYGASAVEDYFHEGPGIHDEFNITNESMRSIFPRTPSPDPRPSSK